MRLGNNLRGIKKMNDDDRQEGIFDAPAKHAEPPAKVCGCGYPPHVGRCQPNTGTESEESTITSLAVIETTSAALVYAPGALTALVDRLKQEVRAQLATLDVSIPSQRARIISLSARVASAKVKLDKLGDSLIEEHRAVVTAVNADRKTMRDDMDAFKVEVRKPVTDLENAEKVRVAAHEAALNEIAELGTIRELLSVEDAAARILAVQSAGKRDWQEFKTRADAMRDSAYIVLSEAHEAAKRRQEEAIELIRLRAAEAERAIKEREEAAAKAAKEAAERRAEEQARIAREAAERERQRVENERIEAEARAKQAEAEKIAAELRAEALRLAEAESYQAQLAKERREAEEAEERAQQALRDAEARRVAESEAAELAASAAVAKAERERYAAVEAERQRVAAQQKAEAEEAEKRTKNRAHRLKFENEAAEALADNTSLANMPFGLECAKEVIAAIAKGAVPHVTIQY